MNRLNKTYVGAAVFFDRTADDGWPEDAGWWPLGQWAEALDGRPPHRIGRVRWPPPFQSIKSFLRNLDRSSL